MRFSTLIIAFLLSFAAAQSDATCQITCNSLKDAIHNCQSSTTPVSCVCSDKNQSNAKTCQSCAQKDQLPSQIIQIFEAYSTFCTTGNLTAALSSIHANSTNNPSAPLKPSKNNVGTVEVCVSLLTLGLVISLGMNAWV
ncbi:hypothetical protein NEOLI_005464 [Neolecta irregularis DAH-3]|uniref:Uncharacterized protein n=1 Tax=Neolecta irregularis (strain DAH-3) TaxID=1198029 RepID=A0A1U7LL13_NEOID|nr:hypothetical protein NEOLI_005464 [Neolecta irregularis DAH-3]|eukprot:OLL23283.1 hypothetical protein NEOLI_005464 [Neolecta irregularis DAH-3]